MTAEHRAAIEAGATRLVVCEVCGREFQARSIGNHRAKHKREQEQQARREQLPIERVSSYDPAAEVVCEVCGRTLRLSGLGSHLAAHARQSNRTDNRQHDDALSSLACEFCGKQFERKQGLGAHRAMHLRQGEKAVNGVARNGHPVIAEARASVALDGDTRSDLPAKDEYEPSVLDIAMAVLSKVSPDGRIAVLDFPEVMVWMEHTRRIVALVGGR